jgi:AraC family transcriptional regulator of adaptative response/methylated-DNA-[protein]-cysteine methyltransferase
MKTERDIFYNAFLNRDRSFEGVFVVGVKTTGIVCRPTCPAKPKSENVEFFPSITEAMHSGYRPCKVCKPLDVAFNSGYDSLSGFNSMFKNIAGTSLSKGKEKRIVNIAHIETDLGMMIAGATDTGVCMFEFADYKLLELELRQLVASCNAPLIQGDNPHFEMLKRQMEEYFKGKRKDFDIPLDLVGTEFQKQVWLALLQIPYGCTTTYAKQAELLGKPSAVRAVANANGKNKISIILPCHRVIGADGTLTGYGGGIWRKKKLLEFERKNIF